MRNIKLILEYDGTNFCGWQWQPKDRTVQGELEKSLERILQEEIKVIGSGRTDSGVHALGQVANFNTNSEMSLFKMKDAINGTLPIDACVLSVETVPSEFHSRFDAKKREYFYTISKRARAIARYYSWHYRFKLNLEKIREASQYLVGKHDFKSFCQSNADVKHYLCSVESIEWIETEDLIVLKITANRFLYNMVRIIVGTLIEIGLGKIEPVHVKNILKAQDRNSAGTTVPARGLCLVKVYY